MKKILWVLTLVFLVSFIINYVYAYPSGNVWPPVFEQKHGDWYDLPWGVNRNYYAGEDGYMPDLAYESLGQYGDLAYKRGKEFIVDYPDKVQRAQAVLSWVQSVVKYGCDEENVFMQNTPQGEWAWNPDEMCYKIAEARESGTVAIGDCEDFGFLCAILYLGAGFDVAVIDCESPGHVACAIYLPEFPDANIYWDIGDGRGYGWIWVEATADTNTLGWTPETYSDGVGLTPYLIEMEVSENPPVASFTFSPSSPEVDEIVTFDASGSSDSDGTIVSYDWDFGDGNTGSGMTATHSYPAEGGYTVTLTVTDNDGLTDSTTHITIDVIPEFSLSVMLLSVILFAMAAITYRKKLTKHRKPI